MDPTLAPGYVPPNNGKDKPAKGHHWAEVQKAKEEKSINNYENGDNERSSSNSSPDVQSAAPQLHTEDSRKPTAQRHLRMPSWRWARSTLSDGESIGGPADLEEVPVGVKRQALRLEDYSFPDHRLRTVMDGKSFIHRAGLSQ